MTSAVIVAAGRGTRMGPGVDKLFLPLAGQPVVAHSWQRFDSAPGIDELVLVVRDGMEEAFADIADSIHPRKPWRTVIGGKERQDSVWNGLEAVSRGTELVAIQDAARPCTPAKLIADTLSAAREFGAAVAAQKLSDTVKESDDGKTVMRHLDRSRLWAVQTPQAFRLQVIRRALEAVRKQRLVITDDTAACELIGQKVKLVESDSPNPKITFASDLPYLELLLRT